MYPHIQVHSRITPFVDPTIACMTHRLFKQIEMVVHRLVTSAHLLHVFSWSWIVSVGIAFSSEEANGTGWAHIWFCMDWQSLKLRIAGPNPRSISSMKSTTFLSKSNSTISRKRSDGRSGSHGNASPPFQTKEIGPTPPRRVRRAFWSQSLLIPCVLVFFYSIHIGLVSQSNW